MLKLHPNQLLSRSMQTLSPTNEQHTQQCEFKLYSMISENSSHLFPDYHHSIMLCTCILPTVVL